MQKALNTAENINDDYYKSRALSSIAQEMAKAETLTILPVFLAKNSLSIPLTLAFIKSWQSSLVEYVANPFIGLRQSLNMFPFDFPLAYHGVYVLQLAYIKQKNWQEYHKIQQCLEEFGL